MKPERRILKIFSILPVLVLIALTVAACGNSALAAQLNDGNLTICHATDDAATPYEEMTLDFDALAAHADHEGDLIPAPSEGCPTVVETGTNLGKLTICHATSSATNPYNEITIDFNGLRGHSKHTGDLIPAPEAGCPQFTPTPSLTTATATAAVTADKVTICHATSSKKNPYNLITVSVNGLNGHGKHSGDIIPAPAAGCP